MPLLQFLHINKLDLLTEMFLKEDMFHKLEKYIIYENDVGNKDWYQQMRLSVAIIFHIQRLFSQ